MNPHETTRFMPNGHRLTSASKHFPCYIINQHSNESQSRNPAVVAFVHLLLMLVRNKSGSLMTMLVWNKLLLCLQDRILPSLLYLFTDDRYVIYLAQWWCLAMVAINPKNDINCKAGSVLLELTHSTSLKWSTGSQKQVREGWQI